MKRTRSSDSLAGGQELYGERLPQIMDGMEDEEDELFSGGFPSAVGEKKRRLSVEQVKALEKNFEVENKLDPERKVRIAHELGLQPRQVAVWFQNRRARWKTKQLERDYGALKSSFDALAADCDSLRRDKAALIAEIEELKAKLGMTGAETEEESESKDPPAAAEAAEAAETAAAATYKDGSSDSDSSAVVFDENSPYRFGFAVQPELGHRSEELQGFVFGGAFDFQLTADSRGHRTFFVKEEQSFLAGEEHCNDFFSGEQNLAFSWYTSDHWS